MEISVILGLDRDLECLERTLWGYFRQSFHQFEILLVDDGSAGDLHASLPRWQREMGLAIRHIHREGKDLTRAAIVNQAVQCAGGNYLVFTLSHCVPRWDFLDAHARQARPSQFLAGGSVILPPELSMGITNEDVVSGRATDLEWLAESGLGEEVAHFRHHDPAWAQLLDLVHVTRVDWNSADASCWTADLIDANGLDERIEFGASDQELGQRFRNAGIYGRQVRRHAVCVELHRARRYSGAHEAQRSLDLCGEIRRSKATWTPFGIRKGFRLFGGDQARQPTETRTSRRAVA